MYNIFGFSQGRFELDAPGCSGRYFAALMVFAALLFFSGLNIEDLSGSDEPRVAGIAAAHFLDGQYVVPRLNGAPFLETPPLHYWTCAASVRIFGYNHFAVRFPSALAALVAVAACFMLARRLGFSPFVAFCTGIVLATAPQFWSRSRVCTVDMMLAAFTVISVYAYYCCATTVGWRKKIWWMLLFAAATGGGLMTKGLIGLALPGAAIGSWLVLENIFSRRIAWLNWIMLGSGTLLAFIPVSLWLVELCHELGWENGGRVVVWTNNFGRFTGEQGDHVNKFHYYLQKLPEIFQPWTIFVAVGMIWFARRFIRRRDPATLLMLCNVFFPLALLHLSSAKRIVYLLPTNPAMAVIAGGMIGLYLEGSINVPERFRPGRIMPLLGKVTATAGILVSGAIIILPWLADIRATEIKVFGFCGIVLSIMLWMLLLRREFGRAAVMIPILVLLIFAVINLLKAEKVNRQESWIPLMRTAGVYLGTDTTLILYRPTERVRGATVFYLRRTYPEAYDEAELARHIRQHPGKYLLFSQDKNTPPGLRTVKSHRVKRDYYLLSEVTENYRDQ